MRSLDKHALRRVANGLETCETVDDVRRLLRPKELDYLCRICALLRVIGVCTDEELADLDEFDMEDDD